MLTIQLHQLQFFAYHGVFEEERLLGNNYQVDVSISYQPNQPTITQLSDTIDYSSVYQLLHERMQIPTPLLETIATEFAQDILTRFPLAEQVMFSILKLHPPITGMVGNVGVKFELKRSALK